MGASSLKWATQAKYEFIERRAFWLGGLNRSDLTEHFKISVPQASKDLAAYQALCPSNIRYDRQEKRYFATSAFKPHFMDSGVDKLLSELLNAERHTSINAAIGAAQIPVPQRITKPHAVQPIVECADRKQSLEVLYQSMNPRKPEAVWRRLTPHSFVSDGLRWHVRAYCHIDKKFKDFLLSRCLDSRHIADPGASIHEDIYWNEFFDVRLTPNPALSASQKMVVAMDYGMTNDEVVISSRKAMLYYFEKRLRLDVAHIAQEPGESPVVISNRIAFDSAVQEATS